MGLKKLNFSGFKSFADKTPIDFPTNLTAIVGPNGCGKSNIVDGIRWVIGEISSKQLRGQQMSDIIFNGTANRKPMGQAIAEIVFDNSESLIGGEYSQYSEIVIRREVVSDGGSNYFINNTRCRRKDIIDMFLGTGLGAQSYAIIGQGSVNEVTDAKPQELRLLIEETAGISKYKERRHATERRMEQTKENLARLNDIRTEIESQLKILKKQSHAAEYYQKLRNDERTFKAQINAWNWHTLNSDIGTYQVDIDTKETALNAKIAEQRGIESNLEKLRQDEIEAEDSFNSVQNSFYKLNSTIAQLEQRIQYNRSRVNELKQEQEKITLERDETLEQQKNDQDQKELINSEISQLTQQKDSLLTTLEQATAELKEKQTAFSEWQARWEQFSQKYAELTTQIEVGETKVHYLQQNKDKVNNSIDSLQQEKQRINATLLDDEIATLNDQHQKLDDQFSATQDKLNNNQQELTLLRNTNHDNLSKLDQLKQQLQTLLSKETRLSTLQKAALGVNNEHVINWLSAHGLDENNHLIKELNVDSEWETALETVLNSHLDAICVEDLHTVIPHIESNKELNNLAFISQTHSANHLPNSTVTLTPLTNKVQNTHKISTLLSGIYIANDLSQALEQTRHLAAHESIVTKDGTWVGPNWLCLKSVKDEQGGVLQREKELAQITQEITALNPNISTLETSLNENRERIKALETEQIELQKSLNQINQEKTHIHRDLSSKEAKSQSLSQRQTVILTEIAGHNKTLEDLNQELTNIHKDLLTNRELLTTQESEQEKLQNQRQEVKTSLEAAEDRERKQRTTFNDNERRLELIRKEVEYLQQNLNRAEKRLEALNERFNSTEKSLTELLSPADDLNSELEQNLQQRIVIEKELAAAKQTLDDLHNQVRNLDQKRNSTQEEVQNIRVDLEKLRIVVEGTKVKSNNFSEQIAQAGFKLEDLITGLFSNQDEEAPETTKTAKEPLTLEKLEQKLTRVLARIENLGPINLTAIDEYTKQNERKTYLDSQNEDLIAALNTLQNAIYKIDQETKQKFKTTFESVNNTFTSLFPKVFNGGKAALRLTSDDLLETGIEIFAQPPGKRNTSIHLLSGGEKTLTAIALIFSMFQLNPAPFCLLDEVDAPLDDENVTRFCNLVKEMSKDVQFIYITHNKIAMEMADQLLGVTMKEPGVSRVVSVDIKQAVEMAD